MLIVTVRNHDTGEVIEVPARNERRANVFINRINRVYFPDAVTSATIEKDTEPVFPDCLDWGMIKTRFDDFDRTIFRTLYGESGEVHIHNGTFYAI